MSKKLSQDFVKKELQKEGYVLLSTYVNAHSKMQVRCHEGHITNTMTWSNFQQGQRCFECSKKILANKRRYSHGFIEKK